ncbi:hypothetical protein P9112_014031 [Eukaryota sp. TZLM1-RC]
MSFLYPAISLVDGHSAQVGWDNKKMSFVAFLKAGEVTKSLVECDVLSIEQLVEETKKAMSIPTETVTKLQSEFEQAYYVF